MKLYGPLSLGVLAAFALASVTSCGSDDGIDRSGGSTAAAGSGGSTTGGTGGTATGTGGTAGGSVGTGGQGAASTSGTTADHTSVAAFDDIPSAIVTAAADTRIFYGHTSHGSQIPSGIDHLVSTVGSEYDLTALTETTPDAGYYPTWYDATVAHLTAHPYPETEIVMWSWCGQLAVDSTDVPQYLNAMATLEADYPEVKFVYMTGHLRGAYAEYQYSEAECQTLEDNNGAIRAHAAANDSWLFDFADIEAYLDGSSDMCMWNSYPSECTWPADPTFSCAHSRGPNCVRKAKAFWWLLARMEGWDGS